MNPDDILSAWTGFRPLLPKKSKSTASVPRGHEIRSSESKLITVLGGKWTTCRAIAKDAVDRAVDLIQVRRPNPIAHNATGKLKRNLWQFDMHGTAFNESS